jgi:peptidoglycan/LPS O-acetylase OafA/YrhL
MRNFGLDFLRALAIILVVFSHICNLLFPKQFQYVLSIYLGTIGVEVFFVLSGFLIGGIIISYFYEEEVFTFAQLKRFWKRRWLRTLPNYYLVLILSIFLYCFIFKYYTIRDTLPYFFFYQNLLSPNLISFFAVSWSLVIEELFYLSFPIVMFILYKFKLKKYNVLLITILLFLLIPLFIRFFYALSYKYAPWDFVFKKIAIMRLDGIGIGVLASFIYRFHRNLWNKSKYILIGIGIILLTFTSIYLFNNLGQINHPYGDFFMRTLFFNLFELGIACLLPIILDFKLNMPSVVKAITFVSIISYSIYLNHTIIVWFIEGVIMPNFIKLIVTISVILGISYLEYKYFEKPIMDLRS